MEQACKVVYKAPKRFPQEAQKENSITLKNGSRGHDRCVLVMLYTSVLSIHGHKCIAMLTVG
eukprot:34706-Pelagomonas_calceolata.AAC.1